MALNNPKKIIFKLIQTQRSISITMRELLKGKVKTSEMMRKTGLEAGIQDGTE
jgi:hypothetical protein